MLRYEYQLYDANIGGMYYLTTPPPSGPGIFCFLEIMEWNPDPKVAWTALVAFLMPVYILKKSDIHVYIYIQIIYV